MADFSRGVIAGFVAGIVCGAISSIYTMMFIAIVFTVMWDLWGTLFFGMIAILPVSLVSLVFGLVYAAAYNFLPGSTSVKKGVVFSVIFWLIYYVILGSLPFMHGWMMQTFTRGLYLHGWFGFVVHSVIVGLILSLLWGSTLGWVWHRLDMNANEMEQEENHVAPEAFSGPEERALLAKYQRKYPHNPEGVLEFHISRRMKEGKTREQAVRALAKESE